VQLLSTFLACGIELKASTAILVVLKGSKKGFEIIETKLKKIELIDPILQGDVLSFRQAITRFFETLGVDEVGIKARNTKGEFSGGPISFKIEGIIQTTDVNVKLFHAATLAATLKKSELDISTLGLNKYQHEAFKVAFHLLEDS
jgi:hypothetical protein